MDLQELREQINKLAAELTAIMAKARDEKRELTPDEEEKFDKLHAERDKLLAQEKRALTVAALEGSTRRTEPTRPSTEERDRTAPKPESRLTSLAKAQGFQAWMLGGTAERSSASAEAARKIGLSLDQKQVILHLSSRWPESMRREDIVAWRESYEEEIRDLTVGLVSPDNGGHYTTQIEMLRALEVARLAYGGMYTVATVDRTDSGSDLPIPTMNDTSNEGEIVGESVQQTNEVEPTFSQLVLQAYKYNSKKVFMSVEYIQDNAIGAVDRIGTILGERLARITNRHFTVGSGNSQPNGIVTAATSSAITTGSATALTYDELVDLEHSVNPEYRGGARFMFADATLKLLKKIKVPQFSGDTAGMPLWKAGMTSGDPDTINGYAYVINEHMPAPTGGQKSVVFGDLSKYRIREVKQITLVRLDELYAEYGQVVFMAWARFDGDLLDAGTHPVKFLTMHA